MIDFNKTFKIGEYHKILIEKKCYPQIKYLIESQINLYEWWGKNPLNFIIRHSKDYPKFKIHNKKNLTIFASDNEACASFYNSMFESSVKIDTSLFTFFKQNRLKVGIKVDKSHGFKAGMENGKLRSVYNLKLSHYIDAAKDILESDSIKKRCSIYLSPLNIFLTPNPRKYKHYKNGIEVYDIGENNIIKHKVHSHLADLILSDDLGHESYNKYCKMCGLNLDDQLKLVKENLLSDDDYISFKKNSIKKYFHNNLATTKKLKKESFNSKNNSEKILNRKNFILSKKLEGENILIRFTDVNNKTIQYDHDSILEQLGGRITNLDCWRKYGYYTNSKKLPTFVAGLNSVKFLPKSS